MNQSTAIGVGGASGTALTLMLNTIDARLGWGLGPEFWSSAVLVLFALPALGLATIRYFKRAKREIETDAEAETTK